MNLSIDKGPTPLDSSAKVSSPQQKAAVDSKPAPSEICDPHNLSGIRQDFDSSLYGGEFIVYDPTTGQCTFYKSAADRDEHLVAIESTKKANLMLASAGDPKSIAAINRSIRENKLALGLKTEHLSYEEDRNAVLGAARASLGSLTAAELLMLSSEYPELKSLADEKLSHAKLRGIPPESAVNMKVSEIDELAKIAPPKLVQSI